MAYPQLPTLPGLGFSIKRTPMWKTMVSQAASGVEQRLQVMSYPLYKWEITYNFLRGDSRYELQTLLGFYNQMAGQAAPFLFTDDTDNNTPQASFTGSISGTTLNVSAMTGGGMAVGA